MTTDPRPAAPSADDGALLSAYLAGELDEPAAEALEARLDEEPALRAALERQREVQEVLAGLRTPGLPEGAGARLRERLAAERAAMAGETPAASPSSEPASGSTTAPTSLDDARRRRRPGGISWGAVGSVAAALVAVAVVGAGALGGFPGGGSSGGGDAGVEVAEDTARDFLEAESGATEAAEGQGPAAGDDMSALSGPADDAAGGTTAEGDAGAEAQLDTADEAAPEEEAARATGPSDPVIAEDGAALTDEDAVRAHLADRSEAVGLLGLETPQAADVAAAFSVAVRDAEPFSDGTPPDRCLDTVTQGSAGPLVPARVELLRYDGAPALAYLLVGSSEGERLDRIEAWVVEPATCATRLFLVLAG